MNIRNTIIEHYRKFFDLHAKGIALDEDDHLNIDWAEDLVKNCFIPIVSVVREPKAPGAVCPKCGCNKITGDGSKNWCLNSECDFVEAT